MHISDSRKYLTKFILFIITGHAVSLVTLAVFSLSVRADLKSDAGAAESHPGISFEADYSEAVFAFNNKNYDQTLLTLDALLKRAPGHVEALELKALTLKTAGKDVKAKETYEKLLTLKQGKETAPYHFELGVIAYRTKKIVDARQHLFQSIQMGFNVGMSQFFLGSAEFQAGHPKLAKPYFKAALQDTPDEIQVASHYYLGIIHSQLGYTSGATHQLLEARDMARTLPDNALAKDIGQAAEKTLAPFDQSQWFGNVSLLTQFDGNVSLVSPNVTADEASGKSSMKANLAAGFGKVGSPMSLIQYAASYRMAYNHNFNPAARDYEFFSNIPSLYLTYDPLAATSFGLKAEGNYTFQNHTDSASGSSTFRPYSMSIEVGPYLRREIYERTQVTAEVNYRPQTFNQDPPVGVTRRSGYVILPRLSVKYDSESDYFNPLGSIGYEMNQAQGTDQRYKTLAIDFANTFKLPHQHFVTVSMDLALSHYAERLPVRSDTTVSFRASWIKEIFTHWSLVGDVGYSTNSSTSAEIFSYKKPAVSLGLSYTL